MRVCRTKGQTWGRWVCFGILVLAVVLVLTPLLVSPADPFTLAGARVVDARGFTYTVMEVAFEEPRNFSVGAGVVRRLELVMVVVHGEDFRPKATGPIVWLNGIPTLRTHVAPDGSFLEAYFLESLPALENAAGRMGRWELIYQPHEGAREVYRVSPTGAPADHGLRPSITTLSAAQRLRLEAIRQQLRLQDGYEEQ